MESRSYTRYENATSSSSARPHYQLPNEYQNTSSSSSRAHVGYGDYANATSSSTTRPHYQLPDEYQNTSSTSSAHVGYRGEANTTSSSTTRPRYQLPDEYQNTTSTSRAHVGYGNDWYNQSSSSISHQSPPAGYRNNNTSSSVSHQTPPSVYGNTSWSTRTYYVPPETSSTSSTAGVNPRPSFPARYDPYKHNDTIIHSGRSGRYGFRSSTGSSALAERGVITMPEIQDQILLLKERLQKVSTAVELADLYDDAEWLKGKLSKEVQDPSVVSIYGRRSVDALMGHVETSMLRIKDRARSRSPVY